jgi:hypothetical protein
MDPATMDLSKTPSAKPPPGVIPNLIDPVSYEKVTIAVGSFMISLILLCTLVRIVNVYLNRGIGRDDGLFSQPFF